MKVKIINNGRNELPSYESAAAAGMDLRAHIDSIVTLHPGQRTLIPTGLSIELPVGYEAQVRPRSGLAYKHGISVLNAPGTIDADYRGDIGVILINLGQETFDIEPGMRIAQMIIAPYTRVEWQTSDSLSLTERGVGGFGHTGKH